MQRIPRNCSRKQRCVETVLRMLKPESKNKAGGNSKHSSNASHSRCEADVCTPIRRSGQTDSMEPTQWRVGQVLKTISIHSGLSFRRRRTEVLLEHPGCGIPRRRIDYGRRIVSMPPRLGQSRCCHARRYCVPFNSVLRPVPAYFSHFVGP